MYETHFGFHRQPFQSADATRAFFVSESIHSILPQLLHALRSDLGIAVVTGPPGSGKTSLLRQVQQLLANEGRAIVCSGASLPTSADLIAVLLQASRMKAGGSGLGRSLDEGLPAPPATRSLALEQMKRTAELWGPILLLIDDAQLISLQILNELRSYTEEEWNGRGLVHCLISAPVSFEEQLARAEYAEFGRRIRCHAFLQPLKSGEAIRFLREHIELAGGKLSQVFSTTALELITSAADGIPRCLSLLADESLVVAAETGETQANEQSVRTALGRLQHLQYNWNASPLSASADVPSHEMDDEADAAAPQHKSGIAVVAPVRSTLPPAPVHAKQTATHATLSPGVIEFGGPVVRSAPARAVEPPVIPTPNLAALDPAVTVARGSEDEFIVNDSDLAMIDFSDDKVTPELARVAEAHVPSAGVVEFGGMQTNHSTGSTFEVGHRFADESPKDSISVEEVDDREIMDLFGFSSDREANIFGVAMRLQRPSAADENSGPNDEVVGRKIAAGHRPPHDVIWICENTETSRPADLEAASSQVVAESVAPESLTAKNNDVIDNNAVAGESEVAMTDATDFNSAIEERSQQNSFAPVPVRSGTSRFMNLADAGLTNRTPVFDRYTWIALGRDVSHGMTQIASAVRTRPLMLTDYGMLAINQRTALGSQAARTSRSQSLDPITVTMTTDSSLVGELAKHSPSRETGSFVLLRNMPKVAFDSLNQAVRRDATMTDVDRSLSISPGLKLWHDGQLIFSASTNNSAADNAEPELQRSSLENESDEPADSSVLHQGASAASPNPPDSSIQQGVNGFFTLPPVEQKGELNLMSSTAEEDQEVFPIAETIAGLRSDMQQFRRTGANPVSSPSDSFSKTAANMHGTESDSLISRAEWRLKNGTAVADATVAPRQILPSVGMQRAVNPAMEHDAVPTTIGNPVASPQFSLLFTRLRENRKRAAHMTDDQSGGR